MQFPKFWVKSSGEYACWGWSNQSATQASQMAEERASKMAAALKNGQTRDKKNYYAVGPLREEVLQEFGSAEARSVMTRNACGCKVLNTSQIMFIDIDLEEKPKSAGFLAGLFGKKSSVQDDPESIALAKIQSWLKLSPSWGLRVYRTAGGLRLICTHAFFDPASSETRRVFDALGCDPLYQKLCKTQSSFRARLTPKPWRCDFYAPTWRWPWPNDEARDLYLEWQAEYEKICQNYSTCKLLGNYGAQTQLSEIAEIVKLHDQACKIESGLPLA